MRRPATFPEGTAEQLKRLMKQAKSKSEFQRIQAVYLRVATKMTPEDIASALGWYPGTVRNIHSSFLRLGEKAFLVSSRGGRHRENLSFSEEKALLDQFRNTSGDGGVIVVSGIKAAYEQKLGQQVPRPRHPDMVVNCQEKNNLHQPLFCLRLYCRYIFRAYAGSEPYLATLDRSDIRGLSTARPVFIAELPPSTSESSVSLIPQGDRGFSLRGSNPVYALNAVLKFHRASNVCSPR